MNDEQYLEHCKDLLAQFALTLDLRTRDLPEDHPLSILASQFQDVTATPSELYARAPELVARLFNGFTEFAPTFPRLLLWFFGGDCLHYLTDEEITRFQKLEEQRLQAAERGEIFRIEAFSTGPSTLH